MSTEKQAAYANDLAEICFGELDNIGFDREKYPTAESIMQNMRNSEASKFIDACAKYLGKYWEWRPTSKQTVVAEFFYQWAVAHERRIIGKRDYDSVLDWIRRNRKLELQGEFRPLIFMRNEDGQRIPVDMETAEDQFRKQCSSMKDNVNERLAKLNQQGEQQQNQDEEEPEEIEGEEQEQQQDNEDDIQFHEQEDEKLPPAAEAYWNRYVELREFTQTRDVGGHKIDTLERRPLLAGGKMVMEEIPLEGIVWPMTMHWPESVRRELGIVEYDVKTYKPERRIPGLPPEFPYLDALYRQRINPMLISPAGVGKTTVVKLFADHYGQPMCAIPMNRGTSPGAFNGRIKVSNTSILIQFLKAMGTQNEEEMERIAKEAKRDGDVTISEFTKIFRDGGHILLDELDAGDENLLMIVNMPLANGRFANTAEGKTYEIHPDTLIWAAANTMGLGVSAGQGREYRGRNALDFATIDRFRMGRVIMEGDINDYRTMYEDLVLAYN
jgi:hypothetical protein